MKFFTENDEHQGFIYAYSENGIGDVKVEKNNKGNYSIRIDDEEIALPSSNVLKSFYWEYTEDKKAIRITYQIEDLYFERAKKYFLSNNIGEDSDVIKVEK